MDRHAYWTGVYEWSEWSKDNSAALALWCRMLGLGRGRNDTSRLKCSLIWILGEWMHRLGNPLTLCDLPLVDCWVTMKRFDHTCLEVHSPSDPMIPLMVKPHHAS